MWWVARSAGSSLGLKCVVGGKVCRVKPWTEMCIAGSKVCRVKPWTEMCIVGSKVYRVKPWTEMCGGWQGLQGQALD